MQRQSLLKSLVVAIFSGLLALHSLPASAAATTEEAAPLAVIPLTDLSAKLNVASFAAEHTPGSVIQRMKERWVALMVRALPFANFCAVEVGYVAIPMPGKQPRLATRNAAGASRARAGEDASLTCSRAFQAAMLDFEKGHSEANLLAGVDQSGDQESQSGGYKAPKGAPEDHDRTQFVTQNVPDSIATSWISAAPSYVYDYRLFEMQATAHHVVLEGGERKCIAIGGVTARASGEPRYPAYISYGAGDVDPTDRLQCDRHAIVAMADALNQDPLLFYKNFDMVAESGVKYPTPAQLQQRKFQFDKYWAKLQQDMEKKYGTGANGRSATKAVNSLTCTNQCVNGLCTRTFPGGRKEERQAPRVLNPLTNNWEWDTTTNACGG